jgi:hypothetical protein
VLDLLPDGRGMLQAVTSSLLAADDRINEPVMRLSGAELDLHAQNVNLSTMLVVVF